MSEEIRTHGVTEKTPKEIMLGAGTIHKGLKFSGGKWNFKESLYGATSGGNKLSITPEVLDVEVDGALVKTKGLTFKQGEKATLETNLIELTPELIQTLVIGEVAEDSGVEGYDLIESRADIKEGDYFENIAFVGKKTDGTPIIAILDDALCTSGFDSDNKNKTASVMKATFECYADPAKGNLDKLPYHIYYPKKVARTVAAKTDGATPVDADASKK